MPALLNLCAIACIQSASCSRTLAGGALNVNRGIAQQQVFARSSLGGSTCVDKFDLIDFQSMADRNFRFPSFVWATT